LPPASWQVPGHWIRERPVYRALAVSRGLRTAIRYDLRREEPGAFNDRCVVLEGASMSAKNTPSQSEQLEIMKDRLLSAGMSRRDVMKVAAAAAGGAAMAAVGANGALAGPAGNTRFRNAAAQGADEQVLYHEGVWDNPTSFDFNLNLYCGAPPSAVSGLLTFDENLVAAADWAERWEANEDASMWTFYIRPNNTGWADGTPVTANDFVYSWGRQLNPENGAAYAGFLFDIKNAEAFNTGADAALTEADLGVKAIDDWTLEVTMEGPRSYFPQVVGYTAAVPAPRWRVEEYGDAWAIGGDVPIVTCGPFNCENWEQDVQIDLVKNPNYWDAENIKLDRLIVPIHENANSVLMFEEGSGNQQLDWTTLSAADYQRFSEDPEKAALVQPYVYPGIWMLLPQVTIAPFDDIKVRRALSHAIDRDRLATVTNGLVSPAYCLVPNGVFGFLDDPALQDIQNFDPEAAMAELVGTPYEGGQNWPEITMYMRANEESYNADLMANDIVAQLKENLNFDVQIQAIPQSNFTDQLTQLQWPLVFIRWWYDYPDPNNGYGDMFYSRKSSGRRQAWSNEEFDNLVDAGKAEPDPAKRLDIYRQAEEIMQTEVGYMPLTYRTDMNVFKPWVKGVPVNESGFAVAEGNIYVRMTTKVYIEGRE
jgi:ABC-type oligopeptide transport system substrate-binding subunit